LAENHYPNVRSALGRNLFEREGTEGIASAVADKAAHVPISWSRGTSPKGACSPEDSRRLDRASIGQFGVVGKHGNRAALTANATATRAGGDNLVWPALTNH